MQEPKNTKVECDEVKTVVVKDENGDQDQDEITTAKRIFDEIVEETENEDTTSLRKEQKE